MPHQCVRCGNLYPDGSSQLLEGCKCGGKFFFFVKKHEVEEAKELVATLTKKDKDTMEQDVYDILGIEDQTKPVILDLESIRVLSPGKYQLDVVELYYALQAKPLHGSADKRQNLRVSSH